MKHLYTGIYCMGVSNFFKIELEVLVHVYEDMYTLE